MKLTTIKILHQLPHDMLNECFDFSCEIWDSVQSQPEHLLHLQPGRNTICLKKKKKNLQSPHFNTQVKYININHTVSSYISIHLLYHPIYHPVLALATLYFFPTLFKQILWSSQVFKAPQLRTTGLKAPLTPRS